MVRLVWLVMTDIKRAMHLAVDRGMTYRPILGREDIAEIFCAKCDWPLIYRDTVVEQYANEPYGCGHCAQSAEHGRPGPGHAQPQDHAHG